MPSVRDPAPREVAGPGLTVASDKPPRQVLHGAVGASTPGFSASEAAWPTRTHSHPMAYFVHVLKRATSPGGHQSGEPEPPCPCCAGAWPPGTGLWPDSGVKYSVRWPLGGLPGAGPWSQCPLSRLCSAQPPGAGGPRSLPQPVPSSSVPRLASPDLLALALCCWLPGFWDLRCRLQLWTCSGPWPAPQAGSRIANSARPSPGQPFPHLPHTWASAPGVSLDRPRPPHRVTSKLPAMASRAGRGCVSRCTPISPWPAARPRSSQGDSASVQATSSSP